MSSAFLELIKVQRWVREQQMPQAEPTGKTETVQNLPRRFRRMNCGDEPHDAAAPAALLKRPPPGKIGPDLRNWPVIVAQRPKRVRLVLQEETTCNDAL